MQIDKKSGVPEEEKGAWALKAGIGVWNSQGGGKDKHLFFSTFLSLSPELMIIQQTTQFKLCTKDYITIIYLA